MISLIIKISINFILLLIYLKNCLCLFFALFSIFSVNFNIDLLPIVFFIFFLFLLDSFEIFFYSFFMKKILPLLIIFLLVLSFFSVYFWLYQAKFFIGRASVSSASFSVDNSYLFLTPLRAKANGQERIRITVFVLNNQGLGVMGKKVILGQDPNLLIEAIQPISDNLGKSIYDVSSNKAGEYYLEVKVDDRVLPQKAHLSFY